MPRTNKLLTFLTAAVVPCAMAAGSALAADETYSPVAAITIPGKPLGSFDISFVDPVIGLYILADRSNKAVDAVDTGTTTPVTQYGAGLFRGTAPCPDGGGGPNDCAGPNGVITVDHKEIWVGDGDSTIKVFEIISPAAPTHTISTRLPGADPVKNPPRRADELCVDPVHHVVLMANDADVPAPYVSFVSTTTYTVGNQIVFDGTKGTVNATNGIEQCQWDHQTGKFYLNIPEVNGAGDDTSPGAVVVLDPVAQKIEKVFTIPLASCAGPQGMAIGPNPQILLGCNAPGPNGNTPSAIINKHSGTVIATVSDESGADEVDYNPADGSYFLARSSAVPKGSTTMAGWPGNPAQVFANQQLGVIDARGFSADQSPVTGVPSRVGGSTHGIVGSHSVAADPTHNQIYVPIGFNAGKGVCSAGGGTDATGCVAIYAAKNDDRCIAQGAPVRTANAGEDPVFMNGKCRDNDRHDHDDDRDR